MFKQKILWIILISLLLIACFLDLILGSANISLEMFFKTLSGNGTDIQNTIIFDIRIPKTITALLAGAALSVSGLQMQTIFRNPLAGPYVLGISSGASLGVAILLLGFSTLMPGNWALAGAAWIGAGAILLLMLGVSMRVKDIMTVLILGIMFGSATSAVVSILQYFSNESLLKNYIIWTMGSLESVTGNKLYILIPSVLSGLIIALFSSKMLNVLLLGENYARTMGLNIRLSRFLVFLSTSLLAGSITAFCGPIGFIGIAVPHIARFLFKTANHHVLIPGSMIIGALIMLFSDIISQLPGYQNSLPINSVTALLGIPIVIWVIIKNQRAM